MIRNRMEQIRKAFSTVLVMLTCVGCDQLTKSIARQCLAESKSMSFLNDVFRLQYIENPGAFLSLWANSPEALRRWLLIFAAGFFLAGLLVFLITSKRTSKVQTVALSLVLGGGVANLIDRIFNEGRVIDFMNLGIGSLRTGVFNVADIAISVGSVLLLLSSIRRPEKVL